MFSNLLIRSLASLPVAVFCACDSEPTCPADGAQTLFTADFETATAGSPPPAGGALLYGPPGAAIEILASASAVLVEDSPAFGTRAIRIARKLAETRVDIALGDPGDTPCCGLYTLRLRVMGDPVPDYLIASPGISAISAEGRPALGLRLFDGTYHQFRDGGYAPLTGSYDPSSPHMLSIGLDLDAKKYLVCVDDQVLTHDQPFIDSEFRLRGRMRMQIGPTITEAFPSALVIDEIRVSK